MQPEMSYWERRDRAAIGIWSFIGIVAATIAGAVFGVIPAVAVPWLFLAAGPIAYAIVKSQPPRDSVQPPESAPKPRDPWFQP